MDADKTTLFKLRYVGSRFNGARLPLDVLGDLPAFRDLLTAFAEDRWRELNPDRKRVPKGFNEILTFALTKVEDGSAMPNISWGGLTDQQNLPGVPLAHADLVRHSYEQVVGMFEQVALDKYPTSLSPTYLRALNRFGAALKDGEKIEFHGSKDQEGNVVYLDSLRRKKLITHVKDTYEKRVEGTGRLIANFEDGVLGVRTEEFGDIRLHVGHEAVTSTFDGNLSASVFFDLVLELDYNDKYRSVSRVEDIRLIDEDLGTGLSKCRERLAEIGRLEAGWHDGDASKIDAVVIDQANSFVTRRPRFSPEYRIYPTLTGGVLFEFIVKGWDYSVEFNSDGTVELYGVEVDGPGELEPVAFSSANDAFYEAFDRQVRVNQ
ncbi:hypothetical protein AB9E29_32055 [Rhizobium leguminosarum]|uniref:hypothetical protein n=1 Tax=Rhizobium leguminosarum TaxID=384 RepID=UPI003F9A7662